MKVNLLSHELWLEFLEYKTSKLLLSKEEERMLREFIEQKRYLPMAEQMEKGLFRFSVPERKELNKLGVSKKRVVYCFPEQENMLLKMLSWQLYRYDTVLSDNCYAFRKQVGPRKAFLKMAHTPQIDTLYGFKADISNYFNSIDISLMLPILREVITEDTALLQLLTELLEDERALWQGEEIREAKGVMAGTPTSPFFANLYLKEMDEYFARQNVLYARYSDDVLIFAGQEEIEEHIAAYYGFLEKYHLTSNPSKEQRFMPGDKWNFLGFDYQNGTIDVSEIALRKLMDKIRRAARSLRRWMLKKEVSPQRALQVFNRKFNRKFFDTEMNRELCWSRWYFPIINTPKSLYVIEQYMQDWQRYLVTGKHNKANYKKVPYAMLVENGYRPLVTAYYKDRDGSKGKQVSE